MQIIIWEFLSYSQNYLFCFLRLTMALLTAFSFICGAVCSGVAGYVGMWVSVRANIRVSGAARRSAREALQVAMRAGGVSALLVVGMVSLFVPLSRT